VEQGPGRGRAGIPGHPARPAARASWLLAGGADLQVVKERLGHGSISTTERYLHTLPGVDNAALDALDKIRGKAASAAKVRTPAPRRARIWPRCDCS
jgi:integrase